MSFFFILGRLDCPYFAHALLVADYLSQSLPDFRYQKLERNEDDLKASVERLNRENEWSSLSAPLIWKVIGSTAKKYLIGGVNEFFEYCYDYFGLQYVMPLGDLEKLARENMHNFTIRQTTLSHKIIISFVGFDNSMLELIINELPSVLNLQPEDIGLRIYDPFFDLAVDVQKTLAVTSSYEELLTDADVLIILEDYSQCTYETQFKWLQYCYVSMKLLADEINNYAKRSLRIILNHSGCTCFNATILMANCTTIKLSNIVAVTADEGLSTLNKLSQISGVSVGKMGAPPVWGWPRIVDFIDVNNIIVKNDVLNPYPRAVKPFEYTLPQGTQYSELRLSKYLINNETETKLKLKRRDTDRSMEREPTLGKVRSLMSLLKLWYGNENNCIISLGVCNNGSFELPPGLIMSQPVCLNDKKIWQPFTQYPLAPESAEKIKSLLDPIRKILCVFQIPNQLCTCEICSNT